MLLPGAAFRCRILLNLTHPLLCLQSARRRDAGTLPELCHHESGGARQGPAKGRYSPAAQGYRSKSRPPFEYSCACLACCAQNNTFFEHLTAFSEIRKEFDKIYLETSKVLRDELETFSAPNLFKTKDGKRDKEMRQRAREAADMKRTSTEKFITVRSQSLHELLTWDFHACLDCR